jgi:hypothetical protein
MFLLPWGGAMKIKTKLRVPEAARLAILGPKSETTTLVGYRKLENVD